MSTMEEVNGTDHLVRHDKETKRNGYDNEGFHSHERSEEEEESASDDDRLRVVVTENGHRPEDDTHLSNGYIHEETTNGHSTTTVNGSAVIVLEDSKCDSKMKDNKDGSSPKPLDTRLHHYVPVDDIDRKILNGSDGTHVTIPEDAVINFTTGRVKVKKATSSNPPASGERESIPLEMMLPSYEAEDKIGLSSEKAELEAELANHKNGLWSEGHNAYSNPESAFGNSEKLNGTSKSNDEVSLPVNNHRKCLSDVSDTSSEQKSTGEKLYFTEDNRKLCPGWRRVFVCGLISIIVAVALLLGVLAATGILLAKSESKNTRYESGHSLPSIDTISHAGHSFRPRQSSKVPQKFLPPVTEGADLHPNTSIDTVSRPPIPTVSSKVPVLNDTSHSQTIVPNALVGEFTIDENFTEDLKDHNSDGYQSLAKYIERELRGIFKRSGGVFEEVKILNFSPGSIKIKFVAIWTSDRNVILSEKAMEIMKSYLRKNRNSLLAYPVDLNSIHFLDVFDECKIQKGGCSFECIWSYNSLTKTCICEENMVLLADKKSCGPKPLTSNLESTTLKSIDRISSTISTTVTEIPLLTKESSETTAGQPNTTFLATTQIPGVITKAIVSISELFSNLTTIQIPTVMSEEASTILQNIPIVTESSTSGIETTTQPYSFVESTTMKKNEFTIDNLEITDDTTTEIVRVTERSTSKNTENDSVLKESETTVNILSNLPTETTTSNLRLETTTVKSSSSNSNNVSEHIKPYTTIPDYIEIQNDTTTNSSPTESYTTIKENLTTIGYHIKEETTEVYTLKDSTDTDFITNPESNYTTEKPEITFPTLQITSDETTVPEHITESILGTEMPESTIEFTMDTSGVTEYDTTEIPTHHPIETTLMAEDLQYHTTMKTVEENITELSVKEISNENATIFTSPELISNETKDFEESTTIAPSTTTAFSISPATPHSNRTPEVRSFDEDFENDTSTPNTDILSNTRSIPESSTETNKHFSNVENLLTSSPVTTPIPNVESLGETALPVNTPGDLYDFETTMQAITENINENITITSTDKAVVETTITSVNLLTEDNQTIESTGPTSEVSTQTSQPLDMDHDNMSSVLNTTTSSNENETTLLSTQTKLHGETENTATVLNENVTVEDGIEINSTLPSFDTSENDTINVSNNAEMTENISDADETTTSLYNESSATEIFETTFPNTENSSEITFTESSIVVENTNFSAELNSTENPLFILTTSEPMNASDELTTIGNVNLTTTIPEASDSDTSNNEKILENTTSTDPSLSVGLNETYTLTIQDYTFPTPAYSNESGIDVTTEPTYESKMFTTIDYNSTTLLPDDMNSNFTHTISMSYESSLEGIYSTLLPELNETMENSTFLDEFGNVTTEGYEVTNETTTNASTGVECREDQFLCEPLNKCINDTFMCDGITDCPDGHDEFECRETCHSNFMCGNSSTCIMSEARCDGIWDCENGTDEDNCRPSECAKHEVMCSDGSKCIKPGDICDWKYNCKDRSDEVGCVERTTCESSGRFFCNDGLCIPWSLKCDGEHDCKEGEDEGNCTCLSDEFQCNDGKCLKSSSRCDGHQDCYDADDEMGCVTVDNQHIISTFEPYSGTWGLLCAEDWNLDDGQYLCQELGFGHALSIERVHVSFNGTWMAMRRENLTESSLWTERVSFVESCTSSQAAVVECQKFACGEYTGLLHRRRRNVMSSSSSQWPFIGYTSTFHSNKGCLSEILTPIWLITSAECLLSISKEPFNTSDWYVQTNIGRDVEADLAQNHEVLRIITHHHSSKFRSLTLRDYDVALIRLKHALVFVSDKLGAICPPDEQVPPGITCFSGVLGTEKPRAPPPQTLAINSLALQIVDKRNCNRIDHFNNTINQRMLCTQSSEGHTICDNDEGTPLMCLTGINKWFLAGMLTYQRFCDVYNKHPSVFSNLFSMRKFLDQVTGQKQYEIPYDSNVYVIIPPTTPSPTMPETTTTEMTTISTTEFTLMDTTYLTTPEFENVTETLFDNLEEINGTTEMDVELAREENYTTILPEDMTTLLSNATVDEVHENETVTVPYGTDFDVINSTLDESKDDLSANRTHSYLMSLNDTYTNDNNVTDISPTNDNIDFSSETSYLLETTTISLESENISMASELLDTTNTTEFMKFDEENVTTVMSTELIDSIANETKDFIGYMITTENQTINPTVEDSTVYSNFSDSTTSDAALISEFNETLEMFRPMIVLTNESVAISQPLTALINGTTEMETDSLATTTSEPFENSTVSMRAKPILNESISGTYELITTVESTIAPTTQFIPVERETGVETTTQFIPVEGETGVETTTQFIPVEGETGVETTTQFIPVEGETGVETTTQPMLDAPDTYTFDVEGKPDADLAISIFKNSDGLKFESYSVLENNATSNMSNENVSLTETEDGSNMTTNLPSINEMISLPTTTAFISSEFTSNITEKHEVFDNVSEVINTESISTVMGSISYTTPLTVEAETKSDNLSSLAPVIENYENITNIPETELEVARVEESMMKTHLTSEDLTVLPDSTTLQQISECGLWADNSDTINISNIENSFPKWSALGYLQMVLEPKMCLSTAVSPSFFLTSLNCLTSSDSRLVPDKWTYVSGLQHSNTTNTTSRNYTINKIIPYPGFSILLNEHDVALIKVEDTEKFSKSACVPEKDAVSGKECFTIGWTMKNNSNGDFQRQFYSVPLSIISTEECNNTMNYDGTLIKHLICGVHNGESTKACYMDLGSPLFCLDENKHWEIQGILNLPGPCGMPQPTVFSSVTSIKDWIAKIVMNEKSTE